MFRKKSLFDRVAENLISKKADTDIDVSGLDAVIKDMEEFLGKEASIKVEAEDKTERKNKFKGLDDYEKMIMAICNTPRTDSHIKQFFKSRNEQGRTINFDSKIQKLTKEGYLDHGYNKYVVNPKFREFITVIPMTASKKEANTEAEAYITKAIAYGLDDPTIINKLADSYGVEPSQAYDMIQSIKSGKSGYTDTSMGDLGGGLIDRTEREEYRESLIATKSFKLNAEVSDEELLRLVRVIHPEFSNPTGVIAKWKEDMSSQQIKDMLWAEIYDIQEQTKKSDTAKVSDEELVHIFMSIYPDASIDIAKENIENWKTLPLSNEDIKWYLENRSYVLPPTLSYYKEQYAKGATIETQAARYEWNGSDLVNYETQEKVDVSSLELNDKILDNPDIEENSFMDKAVFTLSPDLYIDEVGYDSELAAPILMVYKEASREAKKLQQKKANKQATSFINSFGSTKYKLNANNVSQQAVSFTRKFLANYRFPLAPTIKFNAMKNASINNDMLNGEVHLTLGFKTLSNVHTYIDISLPIKEGNFIEPSTMTVNGQSFIVSQSAIDNITKSGTFYTTVNPRAPSQPMDRKIMDTFKDKKIPKIKRNLFSI